MQPHLVHDMGWPEVHETSRSQAKVDSNSSQLNPPTAASPSTDRSQATGNNENMDVEEEMEVRSGHFKVKLTGDLTV